MGGLVAEAVTTFIMVAFIIVLGATYRVVVVTAFVRVTVVIGVGATVKVVLVVVVVV